MCMWCFVYMLLHVCVFVCVCCQATESAESSANQLEQEKHLRAVMEGAYMEGRMAFQQVQHVATENRQRCAGIAEKLILIK